MIIEAHSVSKSFGERLAVNELSLSVPPGLCFGLLGPNGAGKTTTLRMIYGVAHPTSGKIFVFGMDLPRHTRTVRARLGVTLQQNVLIEALSAEENLRVFGRYHLLGSSELSLRVKELMEFLELTSHAKVPVRNLSGGFQRRLAIALSLMNRPELLILDEPTTGLDPAVRLALWSRIRELKATGTSILLTTHYMDEAQRLCDCVAIISQGKVIAQGAPTELIASHLARETVELDCSPEEEKQLLGRMTPTPRHLRIGGRVMFYLEDTNQVMEQLRGNDVFYQRSVVVRPTNLEDVFLALTGTRLEGQP